MIAPWSVDADASSLTVCPTSAGLGVAVTWATGGRLPTTSVWVVVALAPLLAITRSPTLTVSSLAKLVVRTGFVPVWVSYLPLPLRSHWYSVIEPLGAVEPDALNVTLWPGRAGFGAAVNDAAGGLEVPWS